MKIETAKVADLHLDPANVRRHPDRNLDAIKSSLQRFGQQKPVVVDDKNVVRAGNGTLAAARALGWDTVKVVRTGLKGAEATAYAIADNRTAELAGWDNLGLAETLRALQSEDFDLSAVGYTDDEINQLCEDLAKSIAGADWSDALATLPDGDKSPFQQMTFTLSDDQAATVKDAMDAAKHAGDFGPTGNENSNGNALARVAEAYLGRG